MELIICPDETETNVIQMWFWKCPDRSKQCRFDDLRTIKIVLAKCAKNKLVLLFVSLWQDDS